MRSALFCAEVGGWRIDMAGARERIGWMAGIRPIRIVASQVWTVPTEAALVGLTR